MNKPEKDIRIVTSKDVENKKYIEKRNDFFDILDDHQDFIKGLEKIRKKFQIAKDGFDNQKDSFAWLRGNQKNKTLFYKHIRKLREKFIVPNELELSIEEYIEKKILLPKNSRLLSKDSYPILSITKTAESRNEDNELINPIISIEIFDWTTKRDLNEAWKIITAEREEENEQKKLFPKIKDLPRFVWHLSKDGLSTEEIRTEVKKIIKDDRFFGYNDVTKYINKYNNTLNRIRNHT